MPSPANFRHIATILALIGIQVALLAVVCVSACAKTPETSGTLNGKLTDNRSLPLAQAVVILRNLATGETVRGVTFSQILRATYRDGSRRRYGAPA